MVPVAEGKRTGEGRKEGTGDKKGLSVQKKKRKRKKEKKKTHHPKQAPHVLVLIRNLCKPLYQRIHPAKHIYAVAKLLAHYGFLLWWERDRISKGHSPGDVVVQSFDMFR